MKLVLIAAVLAGVIGIARAAIAAEQMGDMKGMDKPASSSQAATHRATGVVKAIKPGAVTLQHGPVASLNWPSMTMAFGVKDESLLNRLQVGKKVEFEFVQEGSKYVVTKVK